MENSRPTLLWGMDRESGAISALPASPLLLPALIFYFILWIISPLFKKRDKPIPLPGNFDQEEWSSNKIEYYKYVDKMRKGEPLSDFEQIRMNTVLPRPSWAKTGEWWTY